MNREQKDKKLLSILKHILQSSNRSAVAVKKRCHHVERGLSIFLKFVEVLFKGKSGVISDVPQRGETIGANNAILMEKFLRLLTIYR